MPYKKGRKRRSNPYSKVAYQRYKLRSQLYRMLDELNDYPVKRRRYYKYGFLGKILEKGFIKLEESIQEILLSLEKAFSK